MQIHPCKPRVILFDKGMLGNNDGTRVNEATEEETGSKLTAVHT